MYSFADVQISCSWFLDTNKKIYSAYRTPVIPSACGRFSALLTGVFFFIWESEPGLRFVRCEIPGPNFAARPGAKEIQDSDPET